MPVGAYNSTFNVASTPIGFDIQTFGGRHDVDETVTRVPWSQAGSVVVQSTGNNPMIRSYQGISYHPNDFELLNSAVGKAGQLTAGGLGPLLGTLTFIRQFYPVARLQSVEISEYLLTGAVRFTATFMILS